MLLFFLLRYVFGCRGFFILQFIRLRLYLLRQSL
jgi:hypothetical protein